MSIPVFATSPGRNSLFRLWGPEEGAQVLPRAHSGRSRAPQGAHKDAPGGPRGAQGTPQGTPKDAQGTPKGPPRVPKGGHGAD